jgi:hypothetical protein
MDKIDLDDAADTLQAYEEQRDKRARSKDQREMQQAQSAGPICMELCVSHPI